MLVQPAVFSRKQMPSIRLASYLLDGSLGGQCQCFTQKMSRCRHAGNADKTLQIRVHFMQRNAVEYLYSGRPWSGHAGQLPTGDFCAKVWVMGGEILGTVVALPVLSAAGTHAARRAAAFLQQADVEAGLL